MNRKVVYKVHKVCKVRGPLRGALSTAAEAADGFINVKISDFTNRFGSPRCRQQSAPQGSTDFINFKDFMDFTDFINFIN